MNEERPESAAKGATGMTNAIQLAPAPTAPAPFCPASENSAVARCCDAWTLTHHAASAKGKGQVFARLDAAEAYRRAMPPLSGSHNTRDFIACTAHGMLIGAIEGLDGARLLYAAQVAHSTLQSQSAKQKPRPE